MSHPFDLLASLPRGRVVIEASAGTGKTYSVAGLVTRALIEQDYAPESLLVTTFTRAAASELRHRVRGRLVEAVRVLAGEQEPKADDRVAHALLSGAPTVRESRLRRARVAVADFESVTIGTIHSLCQRILRLAGDEVILDTDGNSDRVLDEVLNDQLIRAAAQGRVGYDERRLRELAKLAVGNPRSQLSLPPECSQELTHVRDVLQAVVGDVRQRQRRRVGFDGLLQRAHALVTGPEGEPLRQSLQARYRFAVVDEAQDTDVLQWELLDQLFPATDVARPLIVVGDPKQSIYAFRGADVEGYVRARAQQADLRTLDTNFRSDQPLLDQLNALFGDRAFGAGIVYRPVHAPPQRQTSVLPPDQPVVELLLADDAKAQSLAALAARRVASAIAAKRHTAPQIAVLVGTRTEGAAVAQALAQYGVAAVTSGTSSVITSTAATELGTLFRALAESRNPAAQRLAAIGWFGGLSHADLVDETADLLLPVQERFDTWRVLLQGRGVAALLEDTLSDAAVLDRIAGDGQLARHLTDLQHVGELLHDAGGGGATPAHLLSALQALAGLEEQAELVTRRIETDAPAVQVLTIHAAKGLQFPCVVLAKGWTDSSNHAKNRVPHTRQDAGPGAQRLIDLGYYDKSVSAESHARAVAAAQAEDDRLFYVAVTRAQHELVIILPQRDEGSGSAPQRCFDLPPSGADVAALREALATRMAAFGHRFSVTAAASVMAEPHPQVAQEPVRRPEDLVIAAPPPAMVSLQQHWSFTALTRHTSGAAPADVRSGEDELDIADVTASAGASGPGPLAGIPAGTAVGTILHDIFERWDFAAPDLAAALEPLLQRFASVPALRDHHAVLTEGMVAALRTPLGAAAPFDLCLAGVPRQDRRDEVQFDLALPDRRGVPIRRVGQRLVELLPAADALRPWAQQLAGGAIAPSVRGLLTGSIDLVLRHPVQRDTYVIVDYKSNRLTSYDPSAVRRAMETSHYPLQGLLYSVALYRWLRWRTGAADPSAQVGGFAYAFVRGMRGPDTPVDAAGRRHGVFCWQPPAGCIAALSDLLAGEDRA